MHDVIQEALSRHAQGCKFVERNAGTELDQDMAKEGMVYDMVDVFVSSFCFSHFYSGQQSLTFLIASSSSTPHKLMRLNHEFNVGSAFVHLYESFVFLNCFILKIASSLPQV